jgi:hypothetical protein
MHAKEHAWGMLRTIVGDVILKLVVANSRDGPGDHVRVRGHVRLCISEAMVSGPTCSRLRSS